MILKTVYGFWEMSKYIIKLNISRYPRAYKLKKIFIETINSKDIYVLPTKFNLLGDRDTLFYVNENYIENMLTEYYIYPEPYGRIKLIC